MRGRDYTVVNSHAEQEEEEEETPPRSNAKWWISITLTALVSIVFLTAASTQLLLEYPSITQDILGPCRSPPLRREWRTLDSASKNRFISAIQCLWTTPSTLKHNGSLYDDLAYVHRFAGQWSHQAASFLPWHRYFLHIFETTLRSACGFEDELPYWDWSLDWESLIDSPIWDPESGFGGDGNTTGPFVIEQRRCLLNGPFVDTWPLYDNYTAKPHCISRGFNNVKTKELGKLSGYGFRPEGMEEILGQESFAKFHDKVEQSVHNELHDGINGDFASLTSANDPLFYVHHVQMDRLWWIWQANNRKRLTEYAGRGFYNDSKDNAALSDMLSYSEFTDSVAVKDVMSTRSRRLCYRY